VAPGLLGVHELLRDCMHRAQVGRLICALELLALLWCSSSRLTSSLPH
jgi:hypothetical protein